MAAVETSGAAASPQRPPRSSARGRALALDCAAIAGLHALACVLARAGGFDHVSDDDFARVTIAQAFAHAPKLDPSGTSWLPFPFWLLGGLMLAFGRSLAVAQAGSIALASLAATAPYLALCFAGVPRARALFATAFALATPWCIWLAAAPVPESFTASLTAAGAIGLATARSPRGGQARADEDAATAPSAAAPDAAGDRARPGAPRAASVAAPALFAAAIAAASLSRYEPWPVAATLAIALAIAGARSTGRRRGLLVALAVLAAVGPLAWMAWNAHAHDGPLHFFRRVSSFKRAIGAGADDTLDALLLYPRLLLTTRPEVAIPVVFLLFPAMRDPAVRRRWGLPLVAVAAQIAFLAYGNARDGAPAHHPERALLGATVLLALFVADAGFSKLREMVDGATRDGHALAARGAAACVAVAWVISSVRGYDPPGAGALEDRRAQLARGAELRADGARSIAVTPCAYEHFALIAAFGAPERVRIEPARPSSECPGVTVE